MAMPRRKIGSTTARSCKGGCCRTSNANGWTPGDRRSSFSPKPGSRWRPRTQRRIPVPPAPAPPLASLAWLLALLRVRPAPTLKQRPALTLKRRAAAPMQITQPPPGWRKMQHAFRRAPMPEPMIPVSQMVPRHDPSRWNHRDRSTLLDGLASLTARAAPRLRPQQPSPVRCLARRARVPARGMGRWQTPRSRRRRRSIPCHRSCSLTRALAPT